MNNGKIHYWNVLLRSYWYLTIRCDAAHIHDLCMFPRNHKLLCSAPRCSYCWAWLQARFILAVVNEELTVNNQTRSDLLCTLEQNGYSRVGENDKGLGGKQQNGFDYLLRMPVRCPALCLSAERMCASFLASWSRIGLCTA